MAKEAEIVDWVLEPFSVEDQALLTTTLKPSPTEAKHGKSLYRAFDTSILELADDIAYGVHDFEDAIALRLVDRDDWTEISSDLDAAWAEEMEIGPPALLGERLFGSSAAARKQAIGGLVNALIVAVEVVEQEGFAHPLLSFQGRLALQADRFLTRLKDLVVKRVIQAPQVQTLEYRGQQLIVRLFDALWSDPERLLKESFRHQLAGAVGDAARSRVVCDYIAGMTDEYATQMFERLFVPRQGQYSDRL